MMNRSALLAAVSGIALFASLQARAAEDPNAVAAKGIVKEFATSLKIPCSPSRVLCRSCSGRVGRFPHAGQATLGAEPVKELPSFLGTPP